MLRAGHNAGPHSQNFAINNAVNEYINNGQTYPIPPIGTTGYAFYKLNGEWDHQERYEYSPKSGILSIWTTPGDKVPTITTYTGILTNEELLNGQWRDKEAIIFAPTDVLY